MEVIKVKDYQELSKVAADIIADLLKKNPKATLGLATGSSPVGLYQNLIKMYENKEISFKDVKTYNLDEYCELPRSHPESYYSFMHRNLFSHVDIKEEMFIFLVQKVAIYKNYVTTITINCIMLQSICNY